MRGAGGHWGLTRPCVRGDPPHSETLGIQEIRDFPPALDFRFALTVFCPRQADKRPAAFDPAE